MYVTLNGTGTDLPSPLTLSGLLALHKLRPETVVVEHNLRVPPKDDWASIEIREGDRIEIVKFMGGG